MASEQKDVSKLRLIVVQGDNYSKEAGEYSRTNDKVRDNYIWVCDSKPRMMFYSGKGWVITGTYYMRKVLDGACGGFVYSKHGDVFPYEADWSPNFEISEVYLSAECRWVPAYKFPALHIHWSSLANPEVQREGVTWFYNEVTVKETADFTYYCTSEFYGGYMGIQDRSTKWVIFSIWDRTSTDDNPKAPSDDLVKVLAQGVGMTVKRFAGKGLGVKVTLSVTERWVTHINSWSTFDQTQKCDKAIFTGWFPIQELNIWRLLASFQVRPKAASKHLEDPHSFLEDWAGTGRRRQGFYGPAWIKTDKDPWVQAMYGRGTTTGSQINRNVVLTDDRRRLGMKTGRLALTNKS